MTDVVMAPDERALRAHLATGRFQAGVEAAKWRLISVDWPIVVVAVSATARENAPDEYAFRFELSGYPNTIPTGQIWDAETHASLPPQRRPKGERVALIFRTDGPAAGGTAMYAPWDRVGLQSHPNWRQEAPHLAWHAGRDLTFILENLHEVLNAHDYQGV